MSLRNYLKKLMEFGPQFRLTNVNFAIVVAATGHSTKNEVEDELSATRMLDKKMNEMRFRMYKRFIWHKHGLVGKKVRYEIDPCVMELIQINFPLEAGKRKRGFKPAV